MEQETKEYGTFRYEHFTPNNSSNNDECNNNPPALMRKRERVALVKPKPKPTWRQRLFPKQFKEEFGIIFQLTWPTVISCLFRFMILSVSLIVCGHLDSIQLDAASLGNSMINVFGLCINSGFSTACDTYFAQSAASKHKLYTGVYLQRAFLMNIPLQCLLISIFLNVDRLFEVMQQDPIVSFMASKFVYLCLPGLVADSISNLSSRYLQSQSYMKMPMVAGAVANVANAIAQYVCVYVYQLDYRASALCQSGAFILMATMEIVYIVASKMYKETWDGLKLYEALCCWREYFFLAVSGTFMVALAEWSIEVGTFIAGYLGPVDLAVQSITLQIDSIYYMLPMGLGIAISVRVGQLLGAQNSARAKIASTTGLFMAMLPVCILTLLIVTSSQYMPLIFTSDRTVVQQTQIALYFLIPYEFGNSLQAFCSGVLRGCGRQALGAVFVFCGYYLVAIPLSIGLAIFAGMSVNGIWLGLVVGVALESTALVITVIATDWNEQVVQADSRLQKMTRTKQSHDNDSEESSSTFSSTDADDDDDETADIVDPDFATKSLGRVVITRSGNTGRRTLSSPDYQALIHVGNIRLKRWASLDTTHFNASTNTGDDHSPEPLDSPGALAIKRGALLVFCLFCLSVSIFFRLNNSDRSSDWCRAHLANSTLIGVSNSTLAILCE